MIKRAMKAALAFGIAAFVASLAFGQDHGKPRTATSRTMRMLCREIEGLSVTGDMIRNPETTILDKFIGWMWDAYSGTVATYPETYPFVLGVQAAMVVVVFSIVMYHVAKYGKEIVAMVIKFKMSQVEANAIALTKIVQRQIQVEKLRNIGHDPVAYVQGEPKPEIKMTG